MYAILKAAKAEDVQRLLHVQTISRSIIVLRRRKVVKIVRKSYLKRKLLSTGTGAKLKAEGVT
jgi:hypothetical protein